MEDDEKMLIVTTTMQNFIIVCFNSIWGEEKKEYTRARANDATYCLNHKINIILSLSMEFCNPQTTTYGEKKTRNVV